MERCTSLNMHYTLVSNYDSIEEHSGDRDGDRSGPWRLTEDARCAGFPNITMKEPEWSLGSTALFYGSTSVPGLAAAISKQPAIH